MILGKKKIVNELATILKIDSLADFSASIFGVAETHHPRRVCFENMMCVTRERIVVSCSELLISCMLGLCPYVA